MPTKITSAAIVGLDAVPVEVEADVAQGLPNFIVVGLPDAAVQESRERVRTALRNAGLPFPRTRITVNLAPADIRKEGPSYDLPIAVAVLEAGGALPPNVGAKRVFIGELALNGSLRPVAGALAATLMAATEGCAEIYLPIDNAEEASLAPNVAVLPIRSINELVQHLRGERIIAPYPRTAWQPPLATIGGDFADIRGQAHAKRALEIAAAGGHNVLLSGPPGAGKTLLARALPGILPPLTREEALEVTNIRSISGLGHGSTPLMRPFRAPHHSASGTALIGGGSWPRPGEVTLAHRGVLFLDEFPEYSRPSLENLRQPLEDATVTVSRTSGTITFPARFMLVAARNPCPCGYASEPSAACSCPPAKVAAYSRKISGPLLDRIDLHVEVPRMDAGELLSPVAEEPSSAVRERVIAARERQRERLAPHGISTNAELGSALLRKLAPLDGEAERLLRAGIARLGLSARAVARTIRLACTIADLDGAGRPDARHLAEAIQYRERRT